MTDFITVSPDQLPEIAEIPGNLRVVVASPGGNLQRVAHSRLLSKLIATNLAKTTRAILYADLAHDADSVALVFSDPDPLLNGWWRKTGISGAGAWVQFETLALATRAAMVELLADAGALIDTAEGYANSAGAAAAAAAGTLAAIVTIEAAQYRYDTKANAVTALAGIPANEFVYVFADETRGGRVTVYRKTGGVLVFQNTLTGEPLTFHVDPLTGSDAGPGTRAAPFATVKHAMDTAIAGDTVELAASAIVKEDFPQTYTFPGGVRLTVANGGKAMFQNFDSLSGGAWIADGTAWYQDVVHVFGYAPGAPVTSNNLNPRLIYRVSADDEHAALNVYSNASSANAIAYVKANPGSFSPVDMSGGGSFQGSGWRTQTYRVYVRLTNGEDPNAIDSVLYAQRFMPPFSGGGFLCENIVVFGTLYRGGMQSNGPNGLFRKCELYWPPVHGYQTCGVDTEDCTLAHGGGGYGLHHFGGELDFEKQRHCQHLRVRVFDWGNDVLGCHGTGAGPFVLDTITLDEPHFENCTKLGDVYGIRTGVTINRPVFRNVGSIGGFINADCVINDPVIFDDRTKSVGFEAPGTGRTLTVNGGSSLVNAASLFFSGNGKAGTMVFNDHVMLARSPSYFNNNDGGAYSVEFNGGVLQFLNNDNRSGLGAGSWRQYNANPASVSFAGTLLSGLDVPSILTMAAQQVSLTIDTHVTFGGDAGLRPALNPLAPVSFAENSAALLARERVIGSTAGVDHGTAVVTSRKFYAQAAYFGGTMDLNIDLPAGFDPTGVFGRPGTVPYLYGKAGKVYWAALAPAGPLTAVATGIPGGEDITGHVYWTDGATYNRMILFTWDGATSRAYVLNMATQTMIGAGTNPATAYPILGGASDDAGSNLLIFGSKSDDSAGGALKSTDGGTTWAAVDASFTQGAKTKCAARINSIYVLAGDLGTFWTAATVGGVWTERRVSECDFASLAVDPWKNRLIFTGGQSSGNVASKNGTHDMLGSIDCSDANPANWPFATAMAKPFGSINSVQVVANSTLFSSGAPAGPSLAVFGRSPLYAATLDTRNGGNWQIGRGAIYVPVRSGSTRSTKLIEDAAIFNA